MALLPLSRFRRQTVTSSMTDCLFFIPFFPPCLVVDVGRELRIPRGCCVILMGCKCIFCLILDHCALSLLQGC